jgi:Flp pilus assembly pilin Flp
MNLPALSVSSPTNLRYWANLIIFTARQSLYNFEKIKVFFGKAENTSKRKCNLQPHEAVLAMKSLRHFSRDLLVDESGGSAVEYALLISCIATVIAGSVTLFGGAVQSLFQISSLLAAFGP